MVSAVSEPPGNDERCPRCDSPIDPDQLPMSDCRCWICGCSLIRLVIDRLLRIEEMVSKCIELEPTKSLFQQCHRGIIEKLEELQRIDQERESDDGI